ncbi:30S ribosomal protein S4e [Candidatus Woesearchaeota archaeon]|nr:30S ribosomal protein S4e [Candidatus Woesearchaeota archaeon]
MVKKHLFRLNAPKSWPIERKKTVFVLRPFPGAHKLQDCMPLSLVLREVMNTCKTKREAKTILQEGKVKVNGIVRKDEKSPIGFMDVLAIDQLQESFRVLYNKKGKLYLKKIEKKEAEMKPLKILGKTVVSGGKIQLNCNDGTNLLVEKDAYQRNDTIIMDLKTKKVLQHLPFQKGMLLYVFAGKNAGEVGQLEEVRAQGMGLPENIVVKTAHGKFETRKDYSMVIGKDHEVVSI